MAGAGTIQAALTCPEAVVIRILSSGLLRNTLDVCFGWFNAPAVRTASVITASQEGEANYSVGFSSRYVALRSPLKPGFARLSAKRPIIWLMTPCGFSITGVTGPRWTGGAIFSNMNAGTVYPPRRRVETLPGISPEHLLIYQMGLLQGTVSAKDHARRQSCGVIPHNSKVILHVRGSLSDIR